MDSQLEQETDLVGWPAELRFVLSALEAGPRPADEANREGRRRHRVRATLSLFSDQAQIPPTDLFVRDVTTRSLGFLTTRRLPLSHGGLLRIPSFEGPNLAIYCTVLRCREAAPGWYEGAVYFNRQQRAFAADSEG